MLFFPGVHRIKDAIIIALENIENKCKTPFTEDGGCPDQGYLFWIEKTIKIIHFEVSPVFFKSASAPGDVLWRSGVMEYWKKR